MDSTVGRGVSARAPVLARVRCALVHIDAYWEGDALSQHRLRAVCALGAIQALVYGACALVAGSTRHCAIHSCANKSIARD